ncbi:MAG TPA: MG2 domain-containing protein, partial [Anseongella sp.]|nr:MG2 domain-containing protein [Anseongella sp.]
EVYVTSRKSGEPIENAAVLFYREASSKGKMPQKVLEQALSSNANGKVSARLLRSSLYDVLVVRENDTLPLMENKWVWDGGQGPGPDNRERTVFFTDRKVYRPGQTVHFKGFLFFSSQSGEKPRIWAGRKTEASFSDVNNEEISRLYLMSNEFGTFSGSFIIPENSLPGRMSIRNEYGSTWIEVAEYKRPTFEVNFDPVSGFSGSMIPYT